MNDEAILGRIRYAWIHADRAMDKIDPSRRDTVREIFAGTRRPTSLMLALIADATGRTVDWFLHGTDEKDQLAFHVFTPTGDSTCAVCKLSVHAEIHGSYPQVCDSCGHAKPHAQYPDGSCEFDDCGCTGPKPLTNPDVLHLCDRCHGEVYTFPQKVISLAQRMHLGHWAAFTYKDDEGSELLVYPHKGTVLIDINGEVIRISLDTLEAVVEALRVSGLRAVEGDPS